VMRLLFDRPYNPEIEKEIIQKVIYIVNFPEYW
jgi:hypothetical protein